jgi:hypothetical protein
MSLDLKAVRALADQWESWLDPVTPQMLRQCADELDALKQDAERYRCMRDLCELIGHTESLEPAKWKWVFWTPAPLDDEDIGEALDRARRETT